MRALGLGIGIIAALVHLGDCESASHAFMKRSSGWELSAFSAFGAMSGFFLASLGLVGSLMHHERAKDVLDANPGRYMLRRLVAATWQWLIPAIAALMCVFFEATLLQALFIFFACNAVASALIALLAMTLFFRRFTLPKPV